jgi:membrane protein DedA with SNARE-associated domain
MSDPSVGLGYLTGLFGVLVVGAVVPVVPTGAAVSVAAALAERGDLLIIGLVVAFGAAGAYVGDLLIYGLLRLAGRRTEQGSGTVARWFQRRRQGVLVERMYRQISEHELRTLLLSRLVPGGQLPVLVAASLSGYRWRRYAVADLGAAVAWSVVYTASGLAGRAVFPRPWEGAAAAIVLVVLAGIAGNVWTRSRSRPEIAAVP